MCRVLKEEGLFRIPGSKMRQEELLARFGRGEKVDLNSEREPATVAGLLRLALKKDGLPVDANCARILEFAMTSDESTRLETTITMTHSLSTLQFQCLGALTRMFRRVGFFSLPGTAHRVGVCKQNKCTAGGEKERTFSSLETDTKGR